MTTGWPNPVKLSELSRGPIRRELIADPAARRRIARALDIISVDHLEAAIILSPWLDGAELSARWRASVTQACVVTLDPLKADLEGRFSLKLVPAGSQAAPHEGAEITLDPQEQDPPDVLESDQIDLGAYVIEQLALELDPFPRTPGVEFEPPLTEEPQSPFAVLLKLKDKDPQA